MGGGNAVRKETGSPTDNGSRDKAMDTTGTTTDPKSPMDMVHAEGAFLPSTGESP